ncbi:MAG: transcription termination/antitermination protein NusG [Planctomycetaceae bacterium]|nr:transcription termination/antitermination protein NusG [Planctomycetaceae bacterium]
MFKGEAYRLTGFGISGELFMLEAELTGLENSGGEDKVESLTEESTEESVVAVEVQKVAKPADEVKPAKGSKTKKTTARKKKETKEKVDSNEITDVIISKQIGAETPKEPEAPKGKEWYILKVQVNREDAIKKNLERQITIAGLDRFFGDILVPTEKVTEIRNEKKRIVRRKLYPGYLMICMEINDDTWFLVRGTPGIGDFTGAVGKPAPMLPHEVQRMLAEEKEDPAESPKLKVGYTIGDQIKIKEGSFESLNGVVDAIDYTSGRVTVIINLFGRSTPVELEYWQIEQSSG